MQTKLSSYSKTFYCVFAAEQYKHHPHKIWFNRAQVRNSKEHCIYLYIHEHTPAWRDWTTINLYQLITHRFNAIEMKSSTHEHADSDFRRVSSVIHLHQINSPANTHSWTTQSVIQSNITTRKTHDHRTNNISNTPFIAEEFLKNDTLIKVVLWNVLDQEVRGNNNSPNLRPN